MERFLSRTLSSATSVNSIDDKNDETLLDATFANYGTRQLSTHFVSEPVSLTFEDLNVFVKQEKKLCRRNSSQVDVKQILKNVSGVVRPGQLVALMGASGSGKTTLLNVITSRNCRALTVNGTIKVNGHEVGRDITSISAYVQQDDLFIGTLTVREHLIFQAMLRLPKSMSRAQKTERVDQVIFELGLRKCRNTKIGVQGIIKGISGGEAKRLAFASEVLTNPSLLFCDEPTTGLDSYMAQSVVSVLQNLANTGKTVICTIHQPASEVYAMFDRILYLSEGQVTYFGSADGALEFFASAGYSCPTDFNPADFFIQTLALVPGKEEECKDRLEMLWNKYNDSIHRKVVDDLIEQSNSMTLSTLNLEHVDTTERYKTGNLTQVGALFWRSMLNNYRNKQIIFVRMLQKIFMALFVGLIYLKTTYNQEGIMNINGAMFFVLAEYTFPALYGVLTILPLEFPVLVREHHNGMYRVASYYLSKMAAFVPTYTLDGFVFISITYFMAGFRRTAGAFFWTLFVGALIEQTSSAFGVMLSAISPSFPIALTISGPILTVIEMTGGLFTNVGTIPVYLAWTQYLSWFRYGFEALSVIQWESVSNITCDRPQLACVPSGQEVLENLSFNPDKFGLDCGLLVVLYFGFHFIGFLCLWFRTYLSR